MKQTVLTFDGLKKLEGELETLKTVKRMEMAEKIKIARSFGDLSENSEYDEAKNEQALIENRIAEIEAMLKNVKIIDEDEINTEHVALGSIVKVKDLTYKEEITYHIVGSTEASPMNGKISDESPVGKSLLGHKVGDKIDIDVPDGVITLKILAITK